MLLSCCHERKNSYIVLALMTLKYPGSFQESKDRFSKAWVYLHFVAQCGKPIQGKCLLPNIWGDGEQACKQLRACRLRVSSARSYLLRSVTVPRTRKPQD